MNVFRALIFIAWIQTSAVLANAGTIEEGEKLLQAAVAEVVAIGGEAAAKEFTGGGKWRIGSTYVVLNDFAVKVLAHSANPKMVGKIMLEATDAAGKAFAQECVDNLNATGESQVDLKWANPVTQKFAKAKMLSRRVPGKELFVSVVVFE